MTDAAPADHILTLQGIPSELLYFPTENHWVLKPEHSVVWHTKVLSWIDRWAKNTQ